MAKGRRAELSGLYLTLIIIRYLRAFLTSHFPVVFINHTIKCSAPNFSTTVNERWTHTLATCFHIGDVKCVQGEGMPLHKSPFEKGKLIITFSVSIVSKGRPIRNGALQISNGCNCEYQKEDCSSKLTHRRTPLKNKPHYRLGLCYSADYYQRIALESWFTYTLFIIHFTTHLFA